MRLLSQALNALIMVVEETLTRPARYQSIARDPAFPVLAEEIRRYDGQPAVGKRCTYYAMSMIYALEAFYACEALEANSAMLSPIGSLLPFLRGDAWQALLNEKGQSSTEDYRR